MLFMPQNSLTPQQGRMSVEAGIAHGLPVVVLDAEGLTLLPSDLAYLVPDDEAMAVAAKAAGYRIHTPLSVNLEDPLTLRLRG